MIWILIVIVSYLLGSIPSGYLVAKSHGIDIRQHGSKNTGATNVLRVGRYVSLASISAAVALPIAVALLGPYVRINDYWLVLCFSVLAAGLAVWRHHANITRLLNGTESRFGKKKSES